MGCVAVITERLDPPRSVLLIARACSACVCLTLAAAAPRSPFSFLVLCCNAVQLGDEAEFKQELVQELRKTLVQGLELELQYVRTERNEARAALADQYNRHQSDVNGLKAQIEAAAADIAAMKAGSASAAPTRGRSGSIAGSVAESVARSAAGSVGADLDKEFSNADANRDGETGDVALARLDCLLHCCVCVSTPGVSRRVSSLCLSSPSSSAPSLAFHVQVLSPGKSGALGQSRRRKCLNGSTRKGPALPPKTSGFALLLTRWYVFSATARAPRGPGGGHFLSRGLVRVMLHL